MLDVLVVMLLVVSAQVTVWTTAAASWEGGRPVHAFLLATATVPLLVRRRWPLPVALAVTAASWVQYELGGDAFQPWFAQLWALYSVAANASRTPAVAGGVAAAAAILAIDVPRLAAGSPVDEVLPAWAVMAGVWGFGRWMRRRRGETHELATRMEAAERDRDLAAARAVSDERARIARELHDLVAHSMGVIVIQSQAAQRCLDKDPNSARAALSAVENVARQGLAEMRRLLDLLSGTAENWSEPQPSLGRLTELIDQVRAAGLPVQLEVSGDLSRLPAGVDLAAYRIVQEALTNVLKHADARTTVVDVRHVDGRLDIDVSDDGAGGRSDDHSGRGLVGMRERVTLYGGRLEAGPLTGGGYRVRAQLPVQDQP